MIKSPKDANYFLSRKNQRRLAVLMEAVLAPDNDFHYEPIAKEELCKTWERTYRISDLKIAGDDSGLANFPRLFFSKVQIPNRISPLPL